MKGKGKNRQSILLTKTFFFLVPIITVLVAPEGEQKSGESILFVPQVVLVLLSYYCCCCLLWLVVMSTVDGNAGAGIVVTVEDKSQGKSVSRRTEGRSMEMSSFVMPLLLLQAVLAEKTPAET